MSKLKKDPTSAERKKDHIDLAFSSQVDKKMVDERFVYEPLFGHSNIRIPEMKFLNKNIQLPIWVGSMTGGTNKAKAINENLAKACNKFKMGMGLGSCRQLLDSDERLADFDLRDIIGEGQPFYANLGIAQIEQLLRSNQIEKVEKLIDKLRVDGIIIHINPLQEWLQPEGDKLFQTPIATIQQFLDRIDTSVIVKEVGQGMGKESLRTLMKLPIDAIEFAAHGGTNFSKLELLRANESQKLLFQDIARIGHSANEMVEMVNQILVEDQGQIKCNQFIVSGGIKNFLDGYYSIQKINATAIYGQASTLLKYAAESYDALEDFIESQLRGLELAYAYLKVKS